MTIPDKLAAIKARADAEKTTQGLIHIAAQCISQTDVPRLIAEVERLLDICESVRATVSLSSSSFHLGARVMAIIDSANDPERSAL